MRVKDDLSGPDWQRARSGELFGEVDSGPALPPLTDDMPMDVWQDVRGRQKMGGGYATTESGPAGGGGSAPAKPDVDWDFIDAAEGMRKRMYVPTDREGRVIGQSGPTIGRGVDLGQKDATYLSSLGLRPELAAMLSPYLGKKREEARRFVQARPLALPDADLKALDSAVRDRELRELVRKYDAASQIGSFAELPRDTQTAITSLYFQYGTGDPIKSTPNYWRQITTGDWEGALNNLRAFGDAYQPRRDLEAERLQRDLAAGTLPRRPR